MNLSSKLDAIKVIDNPTKVRDAHQFIRLVNYYKKIWHKESHKASPLNKSCSTDGKSKQTAVKQNSFMAMKKIVCRDMIILYPNFCE